jgi:hypothetical protein
MDDARRRVFGLMGAPLLGLAGSAATPAVARLAAVDVQDFGARCDRVADDTRAVQAAIDACRQYGVWRDLQVPGPCRITAPLMIDRPVDTMASEFRILGGPSGGGFLLDGASTLFDSHLPVRDAPGAAAHVLSGAFLRVAFSDCWFEAIGAYDSPVYAQSVRFRNCRGRAWRGTFARSRGCWDILFEGNAFEAAGAVFDTTHASGLRFIGNLFEGGAGPFVKFDRANGAFISGNYTEGNAAPDYVFSGPDADGPSHGVALMGNYIAVSAANRADADFWSVVVGDCRGLASAGNFCNGRLFDDTRTRAGDLHSTGDGGFIALTRSGRPAA